ncbi:tetratricopeptide repeat protein [Rhodopila sp.]|uniref:tetratricopeptide repeat protein n=1 Tax=Rhodopila sp. TaxID=2480087 RepID=UPI003D126C85
MHDAGRQALERARHHAAQARDEAAKQACLEMLRLDPTSFAALSELGALAAATGHRSAARTAYAQAVRHHPGKPIAHVGLADLLLEDGDIDTARVHYQAALDVDPDFPEAHQGLARILTNLGDPAADTHWQKGFAGHAIVMPRYRGSGAGVPLLLLVSARGGNMPTRQWIDDTVFAVTAVYADFHDPARPLPPHALVVNAIGDADLCGLALERAEVLLAGRTAPVINPPACIRATGRAANAGRLGSVPGVVTPVVTSMSRSATRTANGLCFPLLLRAPGFHTGQHFVPVATRDELAQAADAMPGDTLLAIEYLDARGHDRLARKYRVMLIDGVCYPLHLAISADWKVHYFTAAMANNAAHRREEQRFLDDMAGVLGERVMAALAEVAVQLGLDYAGVDFALAPNGSLLLFEANATMVILPPDPDPMWDYRRPAIAAARQAAGRMLMQRVRQDATTRRADGHDTFPAAR